MEFYDTVHHPDGLPLPASIQCVQVTVVSYIHNSVNTLSFAAMRLLFNPPASKLFSYIILKPRQMLIRKNLSSSIETAAIIYKTVIYRRKHIYIKF